MPLLLGFGYTIIGACCACVGLVVFFESDDNFVSLLLLYPAVSFMAFGLAYVFAPELGVLLLQKNRHTGILNPVCVLVFTLSFIPLVCLVFPSQGAAAPRTWIR